MPHSCGIPVRDWQDSSLIDYCNKASVCKDFGCDLKECNGEDDHVHLLVEYPTKVSIAKLVNSLKGVSSRLIRQAKHPCIRAKLWGGALWSSSYFAASCGGAPLAIIRQYIEQQRIPSSWHASSSHEWKGLRHVS